MSKKYLYGFWLLTIILGLCAPATAESEAVSVATGVDLYNRYVWRGLDIASTPSIQPSLSVGCAGFEFGAWAAYTLSNEASESDEIDFWLSYTRDFDNGVSFTVVATDYYYPNAGIDFFNFNNHDAVIHDTIPDPGAHILELGLSATGPESFPLTLSGYVNVYNEAGNNTYFQVDLPVTINKTALNLFCGAAGGSNENPDYYGSDEFAVINVGVTAFRDIVVSESFTVPLSVSLIANPKAEITHVLVGVSF